MKDAAAAIWLAIGALILVGSFVCLLLWVGASDGYDCGYLDAKLGRAPDLRWRSDDCNVDEWSVER